jgi:hypothetical protein
MSQDSGGASPDRGESITNSVDMARKRDNRAEQRRRNELARARGFRSRAEERKFARRIGNRRDLDRLPVRAREQRGHALRALSFMREDPSMGLAAAARQAGTAPEAVFWYVGEGLERERGNWRAKGGDRLYRAMVVNSDGQMVAVDVRGSGKASEVSAYHRAVRHYLETGDYYDLDRFADKSVGGVPYETDPSVLEEMARRRQLDIESIYQLVT